MFSDDFIIGGKTMAQFKLNLKRLKCLLTKCWQMQVSSQGFPKNVENASCNSKSNSWSLSSICSISKIEIEFINLGTLENDWKTLVHKNWNPVKQIYFS